MHKALILFLVAVCLSSFAALVWFGEIADDAPLAHQGLSLLIFAATSLALWKIPKSRRPQTQQMPQTKPVPQSRPVRPSSDDTFDIDKFDDAIEAMSGTADRAKQLPGWALVLRSPYDDDDRPATSWLGGQPMAPATFDWPRDSQNRPLHFLAQIDLAALKPEPETGARAPGLPSQGALLVFFSQTHAVRVLTGDSKLWVPISPPSDLPDVSDLGFWGTGTGFQHWPVDPVAFLDHDGGRPPTIQDPFARPKDWITTWGFAAYEADFVVQEIMLAQFHETQFAKWLDGVKDVDALPEHKRQEILHHQLIFAESKPLVEDITAFRDIARKHDPVTPVAPDALEAIFAARHALTAKMAENRPPPQCAEWRAPICS
ncbi:DUF1963 domain-containing protein [Phaeobacter marinintestinus]|uniref:DUF1963 domain-containing protein n=1 Tax=Falsiphaeobacter marinintestinus TaxID=1492905 RepID=UPI0011B45689|nr:DUF1963 domain-containing protein [Phaeobacter marinintestinus]